MPSEGFQRKFADAAIFWGFDSGKIKKIIQELGAGTNVCASNFFQELDHNLFRPKDCSSGCALQKGIRRRKHRAF